MGIVDYVSEYLRTDKAPPVSNYVSQLPLPGLSSGELWVMPSGKQDTGYQVRLHSINWQNLYDRHDGYVLMENLKADLAKHPKPDYVLVDSRTGHTDIAGICTRQLPNAVVILFFPNEQNRRGLEHIVDQIRCESQLPRAKDIQLHFVLSNVPDLDDEEEILATNIKRLRSSLGCESFAATIHHYNSLSLLNQTIFSIDRPRSRLTHEYAEIVSAIRKANVGDSEGAKAFLAEVLARPAIGGDAASNFSLEERLEKIREGHLESAEILTMLAQIRSRDQSLDDAIALLDRAAVAGGRTPTLLLERAELYRALGRTDDAARDLADLLDSSDTGYVRLRRAVRSLLAIDRLSALHDLPRRAGFSGLDDQSRLAISGDLMRSKDSLPEALKILDLLESEKSIVPRIRDSVRDNKVLCLIGLRRFSDAMILIAPGSPLPGSLNRVDAFNYAMARWGETAVLPNEFLARVVELDSTLSSQDVNYGMCLAICLWGVGRAAEASRLLTSLVQRLYKSPAASAFSPWRYLYASGRTLLGDIYAIREMVRGGNERPEFMAPLSASRQ